MTDTTDVDTRPSTSTSIEPLGAWVVVPDGRIGQVWAQHKARNRWWVAFGTTTAEDYAIKDLRLAEGETTTHTDTGQELPL